MFYLNLATFAKAEDYYVSQGFEKVVVPWAVSHDIIAITAPPHVKKVEIAENQVLVGSAEQSFLQLIADGKLKPGRYQTTTPCFRNELSYDDFHLPYFLKLELIETRNTDDKTLLDIIEVAKKWYSQYLAVDVLYVRPDPWDSVTLGKCFDIISRRDGFELGSYGVRSHPKLGTWIYGTGLAEPRFSRVMELDIQSRIS